MTKSEALRSLMRSGLQAEQQPEVPRPALYAYWRRLVLGAGLVAFLIGFVVGWPSVALAVQYGVVTALGTVVGAFALAIYLLVRALFEAFAARSSSLDPVLTDGGRRTRGER